MNAVVLLFLVIGALDYLFGNRLKLGEEFENGFSIIGKLIIIMTGFMTLAPIIATYIAPLTTPFFVYLGCDPSLLAGILLGSDGGGAVLAKELALDPEAGLFNGVIVGSMMGVTIVFSIPMLLSSVRGTNRVYAINGLLIGILTIPFGCILGGIMAGFSIKMVLMNSIPVIMASFVLFILFLKCSDKIVPFFAILAKIVLFIALSGLILAAAETMTGTVILKGLKPLNEVYPIICNIGVFLAGILPLMALLQKICNPFLKKASKKVGISESSASGFIISLANSIPTIYKLEEMDSKGCMMNSAFLVSGSFALGDHLAFASQFSPQLSMPLMLGKLAAAIAAVLIAYLVVPYIDSATKY